MTAAPELDPVAVSAGVANVLTVLLEAVFELSEQVGDLAQLCYLDGVADGQQLSAVEGALSPTRDAAASCARRDAAAALFRPLQVDLSEAVWKVRAQLQTAIATATLTERNP